MSRGLGRIQHRIRVELGAAHVEAGNFKLGIPADELRRRLARSLGGDKANRRRALRRLLVSGKVEAYTDEQGEVRIKLSFLAAVAFLLQSQGPRTPTEHPRCRKGPS